MKRLALALLILTVTAALWWTDAADRLVHPARHRLSGATLASLDDYVAAANRALGPATRIARLTLPDGDGPVVATAETGATAYLDPPSARVLDTAPATRPTPELVHRPLAAPALSLAVVAQAAQPLANGAPLRVVEWPGERNPDWTVRFVGKLGSATIKVADDIGTATPARGPGGTAAAAGDLVPALTIGGGVLLALLVLLWPRRGKRGKAGRKR